MGPTARQINKVNLINAIPLKKQQLIRQLCQGLGQAGFECFMVGGAVRDLLRKQSIRDVDFATNAHPEQVQKIFRNTIATGIKHGTITVRLGGQSFEVTTYRREGNYEDARHPDSVQFSSSLIEDLSRRDFTINALAYNPLESKLIDAYNGLEDLERKTIKAIGKATERFFEDGLRPVRACRFAATLEFSIEKETYAALIDSNIQQRTAQIAVERFSEELEKGFSAKKVSIMIELLEKTGMLFLFVDKAGKKEKQTLTPKEELRNIDSLPPNLPTLRLAYWRYSLGFSIPKQITEFGQSLRLSRKKTKDMVFYCRYFHFQKRIQKEIPDNDLNQAIQTQKVLYLIRKFLSLIKKNYAKESIDFLQQASLYFANTIPIEVLVEIYNKSPLAITDLQINGNDLTNLGLQGPQIGFILAELLEQILHQPEHNEKSILYDKAVALSVQ